MYVHICALDFNLHMDMQVQVHADMHACKMCTCYIRSWVDPTHLMQLARTRTAGLEKWYMVVTHAHWFLLH